MYGGARGGGKSYLLRWWLLQVLLECFSQGIERAHVMLACESYPTLTDRQISKIKIEFPRWLGEVKNTQADGLVFQLNDAYGAGVMSLRNLDNPEKYMGAEYAAIGIDQVEKVQKDVFDILRGNLRYPGVPKPKLLATANPGGVGHVWVKKLWIDGDFPMELQPIANEFSFVPAFPQDNPYLSDVYWEDLKTLPEKLRKAWLDGDWSIFAGQAFPEIQEGSNHVIRPFPIPEDWIRIRGIDYGYANPFACLWLAKNPDNGRYYVYKEMYQAKLTDYQQAEYINEMTGNEIVNVSYADPSMWAKKTSGDEVTSAADGYLEKDIYLTKANNDRVAGKRKIDRLLQPLPDGLPGLQFFSNCTNTIRTMKALILDDKNVEDVDTTMDDHAYDALRYALTSVRETAPQPRRKYHNPWTELKTI